MVGHGGSSASSYLTNPTFPIPSHCASIVVTSIVRFIYLAIRDIPHMQMQELEHSRNVRCRNPYLSALFSRYHCSLVISHNALSAFVCITNRCSLGPRPWWENCSADSLFLSLLEARTYPDDDENAADPVNLSLSPLSLRWCDAPIENWRRNCLCVLIVSSLFTAIVCPFYFIPRWAHVPPYKSKLVMGHVFCTYFSWRRHCRVVCRAQSFSSK